MICTRVVDVQWMQYNDWRICTHSNGRHTVASVCTIIDSNLRTEFRSKRTQINTTSSCQGAENNPLLSKNSLPQIQNLELKIFHLGIK